MKKVFVCLFACLWFGTFSIESKAVVPEGAIRFVLDGHLYFQAELNDKIPVTLIYDTGSDFLYLDEDYLRLNDLNTAFGRKAKARMGGAGNGEPQPVDIFIDPVKIQCGKLSHKNKITPIIKLRSLLGRYIDGMLGNTSLLSTPLFVNFGESYIQQLDEVSPIMLDGYKKIDARFIDNRIDVKAKLQIDAVNSVEGWFRMDFGSGGSITLTNESASAFDLKDNPKAYYYTQAGGIGGGSNEFDIRAYSFTITDTLEDLVICCSQNEKGALSFGKDYIGLVGNKIWQLYDIIIDPKKKEIWVRRNGNEPTFPKSSVTHMSYIDRTDICDGWIVNGLYKDGIAQQAGIEIGDIIIAINDRPVKEISWEEQRKGLGLIGKTKYTVKKANGTIVDYIVMIDRPII